MNEGASTSPLQRYATSVLRLWWVVAIITVLGAALSVVWAVTTHSQSWTATAVLTSQSQSRAPDQDAVLSLGYVDYFNQATYQDVLRTEVRIPSSVKLTAKTGATSPILYIAAEGPNADAVRTAATVAAQQFSQDVRTSIVAERGQAVAAIQAQIDQYVTQLVEPGRTQAAGNVILDQIRSLQGRLTDLQSDDSNLLKPLQETPGVVDSTPSRTVGLVSGAVGGLILGILVALLLTVFDRRLRNSGDVRRRLDLDTLVELDRRTSAAERTRRIENLANALNVASHDGSVVVAVVAARRSPAAAAFARELAVTGIRRRSGTILVRSDLRDGRASDRPGLVDVINGSSAVPMGTAVGPDGLAEMPVGRVGDQAPYAVFEPERFVQVVHQILRAHRVVVIDAPPVLDASESQVVCDVADHVIVVVERGVTRWTDVRDAVALLDQVQARVTGVVLVDRSAAVEEAPSLVAPAVAADTEILPIIRPVDVAAVADTEILPIVQPATAQITERPAGDGHDREPATEILTETVAETGTETAAESADEQVAEPAAEKADESAADETVDADDTGSAATVSAFKRNGFRREVFRSGVTLVKPVAPTASPTGAAATADGDTSADADSEHGSEHDGEHDDVDGDVDSAASRGTGRATG